MSAANKTFNARSVSREILSPKDFVTLKDSDRSKIKSSKIVPPKLGSAGFGGILVEYKVPLYKAG